MAPIPVVNEMRHVAAGAINTWSLIWFQNRNTTPLDVIRIGVGFLIFFNYVLIRPHDLIAFYGNNGLFSNSVVPEMTELSSFSVLMLLSTDWQLLLFHYVFVTLCFLYCIGFKTSVVKWLVLIGHLSFINRNPHAWYGVDGVALVLMFIMCLAPIGSSLSVDRVVQTARQKIRSGLIAAPSLPTSEWGFACLRIIQIQMAVLYFSSGIEKLYGDTWWSGEAPWFAMANNETAFFPLAIFAHNFWLVNLLAFGTLFVELAYPFLIWGRKTRPYLLTAALMLHAGIAVFLGMYYFAAVMSFGHLAFVRHEWYAALGRWWRDRFPRMEMVYDGNCGFCKRSMAWLLAFDGLGQISIRDYRTNSSPVVPDALVDKALYVVINDEVAMPGFEAYRFVVLRVPGLWWLVPLFYIPFISRPVGTRCYDWVAANRMRLSAAI